MGCIALQWVADSCLAFPGNILALRIPKILTTVSDYDNAINFLWKKLADLAMYCLINIPETPWKWTSTMNYCHDPYKKQVDIYKRNDGSKPLKKVSSKMVSHVINNEGYINIFSYNKATQNLYNLLFNTLVCLVLKWCWKNLTLAYRWEKEI